MDSRFANLRQRDASVSMLRVKMSRRRSQSQKENRDRVVNTRRNLGKLQEMEVPCLDATLANMSVIQEKVENIGKPFKSKAAEERLKQLERWKERKALEKEKEKRLKERKGVFKTGLYHPNDVNFYSVPAASTRAKEKKVSMDSCPSSRVTRSMKQQPQPEKVREPLVIKNAKSDIEKSARTRAASVRAAPTTTKTKVAAVESGVRALSTRSANRPPVPAAPPVKDKAKGKTEEARITRSRAIVRPLPPSTGGEKVLEEAAIHPAVPQGQKTEDKTCPSSPVQQSEEGDMLTKESVDPQPPSTSPSFAPEGFVFRAPSGLSSFKFEPLTPRTADAFLTPSPILEVLPLPALTDDPLTQPKKSCHTSPLRAAPTEAPTAPGTPVESKHDVPYFRSEIRNETANLTNQSLFWESKVEDESIPEEMRDRMRTAVGQARLLMKQRFNQFSGLVDDCELGRGEKITTCTDLQGFWDMIYFQVEDVNKKFEALQAAEGRGWVEEHRPAPRQRKVVKKPAAAPAKATGTKAAAKSRLAAIKAAMKAKNQAAKAGDLTEGDGAEATRSVTAADAQTGDAVLFDAGFFQVASPAKPSVSLRRSSRLSAAVLAPPSPCSTYLSPRRSTRRSKALAHTPTCVLASPARLSRTPVHFRTPKNTPTSKPMSGTPQNTHDGGNIDLSSSSVQEKLPGDSRSERSPSTHSQTAPTEEVSASVPEINTTGELDPVIVDEMERDPVPEPMEGPNGSLRLSLSPSCETLPQVSNPPPDLSFTLSPAAHGLMDPQPSTCHSANHSMTDDAPGLDTCYFQPQSCSLSPLQAGATDSLSPMALDVEMESPRGHPEEQQDPALPVVSMVSPLLNPHSPQVQTAESALLLFTPNVKDRIRQSVCPSDLMVFTPPKM